MRKLKFSLILVCLIGWQAFSQNEASLGKNIVKFNVASLISRNYQIGAERVLFKPISVGVWYSTVPMGQSPSLYTTRYALNFNEQLTNLIEGSDVEYHAFIAELRLYFGKGPAKGFYIAPFYQTAKYNFENFPFEYESDAGTKEQLPRTRGSLYRDSYGLMIGVQFNIGRHLVLDCFIGPNYTEASGNFLGLAPNLSFDEKESLRSNLETIFSNEPNLLNDIGRIVTSSTGALVEIYPDWIDLRAGLCIGFRF